MSGLMWKTQEVEILKKMAAGGCGVEDIAKVLKSRTPAAIKRKAEISSIHILHDEPQIDFDAFKKFIKQGGQKCL